MIALQSENISLALPRADLSAKQRNEMFELLAQHFDGVTRAQFERDLGEKNWVILLTRGDRLVGFSTLLAYESVFDGQTFSVIYSGDTIVAPEAWGTTALSRAWIACVRQLREHFPRGKYYWLLLTSGFRTYRFLPVFWREFYPRFDVATPVNQKHLLDQLAHGRFGEQYNSEKGIVRFTQPQRLRSGLDAVPTGRSADPHVAFFLKQNSGHVLGDELVCLTELADDNLTPAGKRMIQTHTNEFQSCHC
jgi:hypothetical protein